ncbi:winged helix-turn-helix transcriptional regulator [Aureimonas fodinaquatilis]|nr:helix-turn-helix domain-containing protein [Aureimonas fodinaquatilis]
MSLPNKSTPDLQSCPIRDVLDRIGDQWSFLILLELQDGVRRFSELNRAIDDVSKQMLSRTLKRLEQDGFVHRQLYPEIPPRVEYRLTELGRSFLVPLNALVAWADAHHSTIRNCRKTYDAAP